MCNLTKDFTLLGCSVSGITDDPDTENARIGYSFYYNDGTQDVLLSTQYFRYKDVHPTDPDQTPLRIYEPSIPTMDNATWNRVFNGWSKDALASNESDLLSVNDLNAELVAYNAGDYNERVIKVMANLDDVFYVTYVDVNPNNVLLNEIVPKAESGQTTFTIKNATDLRPNVESSVVLDGWFDINDPDTVYSPGQTGVAINSNITLYPKIEGGHWLIFNDNDPVYNEEKREFVSGGASFTPAAFYMNTATVKPADPTWAGYEFGGWYVPKDGHPYKFDDTWTIENDADPFQFGNELTSDTTVYAKWIPAASSYRVIVWKQRTTDAVDTADDKKAYDYVSSELFEDGVTTGQTVTLEERFKNIYGSNGTSEDTDKAYFVYNANNSDASTVVKADGTSVLNVYYDRKPVTLNFYTFQYTRSNNGMFGLLNNGTTVRLGRDYYNNVYYWTYNNTPYTGNYYIAVNGRASLYTGELNYSTTYYGVINGYYVQLTRNQFSRGNAYRYNGAWVEYDSFTGLYGSTFTHTGYTWPTEYWWHDSGDNYGGTSGTRTTVMTAFLPTDVDTSGDTVTKNFYGATSTGTVRINFYVQELDGTYSLKEYVGTSGGTFYITDKYIGYHAAQYRVNNAGSWNSAGTANSKGYYNNGAGVEYSSQLDIRFDLNDHTLTFYTNNERNQLIEKDVKYSESLAGYANQNPGQRTGHYFEGWYADPGYTKEFDFNQTMPDNNVAVYGKWRLRRVRVVIVPNATNVDMGSQATKFRVDYDERISGSLLESATRAGYKGVEWYTDPGFTNRFLFSNPVNDDEEVGVDWTYQDLDKWKATRIAYGDNDEAHKNVRGILHLYAKWISDPDARGVNIVYEPGDAVVYDSLGDPVTTVPVDVRMYDFSAEPPAQGAPNNYSDMYKFRCWQATKADGTTVDIYPGNEIDLDQLAQTDPVLDSSGEVISYTVVLRAVYDLVGDTNRQTRITFDGNTFSVREYGNTEDTVLHGKTKDGTQRETITLNKEVNQTIELPGEEDFFLDGWKLMGWSFTEGPIATQRSAATTDEPNFDPGEPVAADNLVISDVNNEENILYAMWEQKQYTVTVKQVVESGVPVNNFLYIYQRGEKGSSAYQTENIKTLTGNSTFVEENFLYYGLNGHVFTIATPEVADDASYGVRVNAIVNRDDGTTEILQPTADGDYQILGDVTITYTYSPKVLVTLEKRDAANHSTLLSGAEFVVTPVEFSSITSRWEPAGDGLTLTVDQRLERYLQEGTYRISEITSPNNYSSISTDLYLTVEKGKGFTLFNADGSTVNNAVAELNTAGTTLMVYDKPMRKIIVSKTVRGADKGFAFMATIFEESSAENKPRLKNAVVGMLNETELKTDNAGEVTFNLKNGESVVLNIPDGCYLAVKETFDADYLSTYSWKNGSTVESTDFYSVTNPIQINEDGTLAYTNIKYVAPTGVDLRVMPYALMMIMGAAMAAIMLYGKKRRMKEN